MRMDAWLLCAFLLALALPARAQDDTLRGREESIAVPAVGKANASSRVAQLGVSVGSDEPVCFVSFGCWGGLNMKTQAAVAARMAAVASENKAKFVIAAGDNFYKKGVTSVNDPRFRTTFEEPYSAPSLQVPWLIAFGNHDYRGDVSAQISYTTAQNIPGSTHRWYLPTAYYAVTVGRNANVGAAGSKASPPDATQQHQLLVVVLDCPLLERCHVNPNGSPRCWDNNVQRDWTEATLEREAPLHRFTVVVCHYPLEANGPHLNHPWLVKWLEPLLEQHRVALYINADNHYIQVSRKNDVFYVNSGGGGGFGKHHTPQNKGYAKSPHNVFEKIDDGVFLHCVEANPESPAQWQLRSVAVPVKGGNAFSFVVPSHKPESRNRSVARANGQGATNDGHKVRYAVGSIRTPRPTVALTTRRAEATLQPPEAGAKPGGNGILHLPLVIWLVLAPAMLTLLKVGCWNGARVGSLRHSAASPALRR